MIERITGRAAEMYHRSSIRYTVFISFTLSALVSILMTGVTVYVRFSNELGSTLHGENKMIVEQVGQTLNNYLSNMIRLSDSVSYQVIKNTDVGSASFNSQLQLLYDTNNTYVKNITLFSSEGDIVASAPPSILKNNVDVTQEAWFTDALSQTENLHFSTPTVQNLFLDMEGQYNWTISLSCAAEITDDKVARKGVLLIDLRYSGISELLKNITLANGGYVFLLDSNGKMVYHPKMQLLNSGLIEEIDTELAGYREGEYVISSGGKSYSAIIRSVGYTGWLLAGVIPQQGITLDGVQNIIYILLIFFIYFAIIVLVNSILSNKLTNPIKNLEYSVQQVEQGVEQAGIYIGGSYEIHHLGRSVQKMVNSINKLTEEILEEQRQKQKSELDALQAQINPHFLYNTLDILVWMIEKGRPEEALEIVSALARFFRLSLSKGRNIVSVNDELEHVRNYLMIQQKRYKNKFEYQILAAPETIQLSSVKLVVQPIVENAILHGMDFVTDGDGMITIGATVEKGELLISVRDNGLGMPQDMVDTLLTRYASQDSKGAGIGIRNVHERIALYFGKEYGVTIESEPDAGTTITLHMPAIPYSEMEGQE